MKGNAMLVARGTLVLALLLLARQIPAAEPDEPADVAAMFAKMRANLARISSIEFTSGTILKRYTDDALTGSSENEASLAYASGKFRHRYAMKLDGGSPSWRESAYDGVHYQRFSDNGVLGRSSKSSSSPYGSSGLFFYPYMHVARPDPPYTVESCLDEAKWNRAVADAVLEGVKDVEGQSCQVIRIRWPYQHQDDFRRIYAAIELEYLPIRIDVHDAVSQGSLRVTQWESRQTPAGRVVIAMAMESKETFKDSPKRNPGLGNRTVTQRWINADGLKINHEIPAERFTIPLEQVKRVIYED